MNAVRSIVVGLFCLTAGMAQATPLYQCPLTVSGYAEGKAALTDFPVLVRISTAINGFSYGDCAAGGADISFTSEDGETVYPHEVDTWNPDGESLVWVKLPSMAHGTKFLFRWSDPNPPANDSTQVWPGYIGVWHFSSLVDSATVKNSATNDYDLKFPEGMTGSIDANAPAGMGLFIESGVMRTKDYEPEFAVGSMFTATGWFLLPSYAGTGGTYAGIVSKKVGLSWSANTGWYFQMNQSKTTIGLVESGSTETKYGSLPDATQNWNHFALICDGTYARAYFNGSDKAGIDRKTTIKASTTEFQVGTAAGYFDEYRLRKGAVSVDWARAEYETVATEDYLTVGTTEILSPTAIAVSSDGLRYGVVSPDYGLITEPVAGTTYDFSCTVATQTLNEAGTTRAVCTGWELRKLSNGELIKSSSSEGERQFSCSHEYVQDEGVELKWRWQIQYLVTATAGTGGTVSPTEQWVDAGTTCAPITATANDGCGFYKWTGDVPAGGAGVNPLAFPVNEPLAVAASFGKCIYVALGGSDDAAGTEGAPYASIEKAVASAGAGDIINVGEGTFALPTDLTLENTTGWKLRGAGIGKTILNGGGRHVRCFKLDHADAELSGFTLSGVTWNRDDSSLDRKYKGCAIYMTAGSIHDVRVTGATSAKTYWTSGTALYMTGGSAVDCIFDGCSGAQGECYGIVYQSGGLTERCTFYGNVCAIQGGALWLSGGTNSWSVFYGNVAKGGSAQGGAVRMSGGTLMHATIWGNGAGTDKASNTGALGGGLYHAGGVVTNCLVWGNSAPSQTAAGKPDWYTTKNATDQQKLIFNLCTTDAKGVNPIPYDPQLRDPANGDFSLHASSPCILADGTTVGAIAYDRTKPDAAMTVSPRTVYTTDAVTFAATTRNVESPEYSWVITDANGTEVKTSSEASFSSTFDAGIYDVSLIVTDGETPVATDTRLAYFRIHPLTNVVEKADEEVVATAELQDALENAPDGQVVIFGEGTWTLPNVTIQIDRNIKVFGAGADKTTFRGGSRDKPCFKLTNSGAEMADFTLDNVTLNKDNECRDMTGIGFYLSAGFLHDCAITNINCDKTGNLTGIGVYMVGGHMADVLIDNCHGTRGDMVMNGIGVRQTAGLSERLIIRNCYGRKYGGLYLSGGSNTYSRIYNNVARGSDAQGGGVTMTGGTLLHATIWGNGAGTESVNTTGAQGGGLYHSSGVVTNCIVWGNSAPSQSDSSTGKPDWYSTKESTASSYFFNFCSTKAIGVNPIAQDPQFVDAEKGDFSVQSSSPCIFETFTVGAVEYDRTQPDAAMTVSPVKAFDTDTVEFTSTIQNIDDPHYAWTVTDADGEIVKTSTEADFSSTFDKGVYDIKLVVSDGDREVKTDERLAYLTIYAKTNTVTAGVKDALKDALADTFDGQVFLLEDGIHEVTATLTLDKDLKLIGGGSDKCIIKKSGSSNRAIYVNNAEALVTGVAITGGYFNDDQRNSWGAGVLIGDNGGTVSWCCITNNKTSGHFMRGGGVGMTGNGLVSHCIIADNSVQHLQADYGGGAALSKGRLENCLITGNSAIYGGGVALAGSGKVRNCTIVGNTASGGSGGLCWWNASDGSAKVLNCVFSGNSCDADISRVKPNVGFVGGDNNKLAYLSCSNSVSSCGYEGSALLGVGSVALSDPFENAASGDYRLKLSAAAVNAGSDYEGLAELDLAAGPRVIGDVVDMGAYETDTDVFGASFAMDKTEALLGVAFTATATVNGTDDYDCEWTVYGPDGAAVKTFSGDSWTWTPETDGWYRVTMTVTDNEKASDPIVDDRDQAFYVAPARIDLAENASIHDALARALDGTKICLSAGEYVTTARVTVTKGVVIEGPGYKLCTVRAGTNWVGDRRVFYLNHPKVTLRGMTITGGQMGTAQHGVGDTRNLAGGGVYIAINGGTVEDCRITGNRSGTYQNCGGGVGIASAQGVVRNCIIDHNTVLCTSTQEYGGGAYLTAGVMSNCVIHSNVSLDGGGVYIAGGALVANCTIVSNRATNAYGGLFMTDWATANVRAKVRDSIIWGNVDASTSPKDGTTTRPEYGAGAVINNDNFNYCAFSEGTKLPTDDARNLMGEGNFTCNPGFKRFDKLDFRIKMFSPCDRVSSTGSWLGALEPYPAGLLLLVK